MNKRYAYSEGDWFGVPLPSGGFAVGVIARMSPDGVLVGYFFGPRLSGLPEAEALESLRPDVAVSVQRFGDPGIVDGEWPILGRSAGWHRDDWPMPVFGRVEPLRGRGYRSFYADDNPNSMPREEEVPRALAETLPNDGVGGAVYVERVLDRLIG